MKKLQYKLFVATIIMVLADNAFADHPLPKTGQTVTYAAGDDGAYQSGLAQSFTTNANGTITDNTFGLMWQNSYADNGGTVPSLNHASAIGYCEGLTLAGHEDWRLPTRRELKSLVDYAKPYPSPAIHDAFVSTTRTDGFYRTVTDFLWQYNTVWTVAFLDYDFCLGGCTGYYAHEGVAEESESSYVRCVRGEPLEDSTFSRSNGIVTDSATGLQWQDDFDNNPSEEDEQYPYIGSWNDALAYCENLTDLGYSDWRLPNINELHSIVDGTTAEPSIDPVFIQAGRNWYWSSTTYASDTSHVWAIEFNMGLDEILPKTANAPNVRCVRGSLGSLNSAPTDLNLSNTAITENSPIGTVIGELNATDPNSADTHTFSLTCNGATGAEGNFSIATPTLKSAVVFDYETRTSYSICVKVTDNGGLSYEKNVTITIDNNTSDDPVAEINVKGNGVSITDGDTTPSTSDHSDFGSVNIASGSVVRTFTIENNGTAMLSLTGTPPVALLGSSAFSVTAQPSTSGGYTAAQLRNGYVYVGAGYATTFTITFDPSTAGTHTATVSIANSDADENPYTFDINGSGYEAVVSSSSSESSSSLSSSSSSSVISSSSSSSSSSVVSSSSSSSAPSGDNDGLEEDPTADGNFDATPDAQQSDVGNVGSVTVESQGNTTLSGLSSASGAQSVTLSSGGSITLPYGTVSFTVSGLTNGGTAQISLYYPYDTTITGYAKNINGTWYDMNAAVDSSSGNYTKVSFSITDNSMFDLDGQLNGEVRDPGGAYRAASSTVAVPLFGLPGFVVLALLLGLGGFGFARRRG